MKNETLETLNRLAEIVGQSSTEIVSQYMIWYIANSAAWIIFGLVIMTVSWRWTLPDKSCDRFIGPIVCKFVGVAVGALFVVANISDLIAPKAVAINRLIQSIG